MSSKTRLCFLGTPEFAVPPLEGLLQDPRFEIVGVVTQPDRPAGRKQILSPGPVKQFCLERGLTVISPASVNDAESLETLRSWDATAAIVVAFGQILKVPFLESFPQGAFNIHYSLLPRWRGAAPVQRSLEAGDLVTGVSLQKIVLKLDAGDVLGIRELAVTPEMNARDIFTELAPRAIDLLTRELIDHLRGKLVPTPQDQACVTYAKKIEKTESIIRWQRSAKTLHDQVRAFVLGPGSFFQFRGKRIKVLKTSVGDMPVLGPPGALGPGSQLDVQTSEGTLRLLVVQPESRNAVDGETFRRGLALVAGEKFE